MQESTRYYESKRLSSQTRAWREVWLSPACAGEVLRAEKVCPLSTMDATVTSGWFRPGTPFAVFRDWYSLGPTHPEEPSMADLGKAIATQLANIEKRTGKSLAELSGIIKKSGLKKHGELVAMLKTTLGMGHGDANTLVHTVLKSDGQSAAAEKGISGEAVLDGLYVGPKAALRPIHDKLISEIRKLGDFEEAPKKTYVSYRRKRQFTMIGPATNTRVEVGLNMKGIKAKGRLEELPPGQMCQYKVKVTTAQEVDAELLGWIKTAFEAAG